MEFLFITPSMSFSKQDLLHSCDSWRVAAQGDFEVSSYLGNIRLVCDSPDTSPEHYRSSDEEAEAHHV